MNKKLFNIISILFIFLSFSSCVMDVNEKNNEERNGEISFSFRTIDALDGTKLTVTLFDENVEIAKKSQLIKKEDTALNFSFPSLSIGKEINVKAEIKLNGKLLYSGSEKIEIKEGSNDLKLSLQANTISLTLSPTLNIDLNEVDGATFKVNVNGKNLNDIAITRDTKEIITEEVFVKVGEKIHVRAEIVNNDGNVIYKTEKTFPAFYDNQNLSLDLDRESVMLKVEAPLLENSFSHLQNCEYIFYVDDREIKGTIDTETPSISSLFGYHVLATDVYNIRCDILKNGEVIFTSNKIDKKQIQEDMNESGYCIIPLSLYLVTDVSVSVPNAPSYFNGATLEVQVQTPSTGEVSKYTDLIDTSTFVDGTYTFTKKINVSVGDEISAVIEKDGEVFYASFGNTHTVSLTDNKIALTISKKTSMLSLDTTVPIKDLDTPSFLQVKRGDVLVTEKEFTPSDDGTGNVNVKTNQFKVDVGEELIVQIVSKNVSQSETQTPTDLVIFEGRYTVKQNITSATVTLTQKKTKLIVTPPTNIDLTNYRGYKFEVSNGTITKQAMLGDVPPSPAEDPDWQNPDKYPAIENIQVCLGYVDISPNTYNITAKIYNDRTNEIFYDVSTSYSVDTLDKGTYTLERMNRNDGTVIFSKSSSSNLLSISYLQDSSNIDGNVIDATFNNPQTIIPGADFADYALDANGGLWTVDKTLNTTVTYIPHGIPIIKSKRFNIASQIKPNLIRGEKLYSLTPYKDTVMFLSFDTANALKFYHMTFNKDGTTLDATAFNSALPSDIQTGYIPGVFTINGNTVVVAFLEAQSERTPPTSVRIYKGTIDESGKTVSFEPEVLFDSKTFSMNGVQKFKNAKITISDIVIDEEDIYALILDKTSFGNDGDSSRGALLKISKNESSTYESSLIGFTTIDAQDSPTIMDKESTSSYFVGPRKIIALKPKKLIIADSGAYKEYSSTPISQAETLRRIAVYDIIGNTLSFGPSLLSNSGFNFFGGEMGSGYSVD